MRIKEASNNLIPIGDNSVQNIDRYTYIGSNVFTNGGMYRNGFATY